MIQFKSIWTILGYFHLGDGAILFFGMLEHSHLMIRILLGDSHNCSTEMGAGILGFRDHSMSEII